MKYALMIRHQLSQVATLPQQEMDRVLKEHEAFTAALKRAGVLVGERGLRLRPEMVRVNQRKGDRITADGPHAETKEVVGGIYLVDCKDRDEALGWAKKHPMWSEDTVELREIWDC